MDSNKNEEFGPPMHDHIVQYNKKVTSQNYLAGISILSQAQLLKQKCVRDVVKLLGIKSVKEVKQMRQYKKMSSRFLPHLKNMIS